MGGGDLNLKKSWTVHSMKNQSRVWEAEQAELAERKKIEQVRRERQEEAQMEEIARLAEEAGGSKRQQRVEWMYSGAAVGSGTGTSEEQEAFLLGKRRVVLKQKPVETSTEQQPLAEQDPIKGLASKVAQDPLLLIQKQEQEAMKKAALLQAKAEESKRRRERESRRHYHSDRQLSSRYRDDRSRSPRRSRPDRYHSSKAQGDRSHSADRKHSYRHKSRSPYRKHGSRHDRSRSPRRDSHRRRDDRSRSPNRHSRDYRDRREPKEERSRDDDREARLAAMRSDAADLESDRTRRLAEMEKKETEDLRREEQKRNKGTNFTAGVYQQTENVGLASRLNGPRNSAVV